jgi:transcriptional regulator with XRE-family HTH domain
MAGIMNTTRSVRQGERIDRWSEHMMMEQATRPPLDRIAASIRRERERAGLSLSELARSAGVAKSTLSQLESGTGNPSLETLWALSVALDVPFSRLVDGPPRPRVTVLRRGEGAAIASERANYVGILLASCPPGARRDIYLLTVEPGPPYESAPHSPGILEHAVIGSGRALVGPVGQAVELGPGDYMCYPGDVPHAVDALEPGTMVVMAQEYV